MAIGAVFRNCRFLGWQIRFCSIAAGSILKTAPFPATWIYLGAATAWFEKCRIHCLGDGYITAVPHRLTSLWICFLKLQITGDKPEARTYLGRPWRIYAGTIFPDTECPTSFARKAGLIGKTRGAPDRTLHGVQQHRLRCESAGARPVARQLTQNEVAAITPGKVLGGSDDWDAWTGR